MKKLICIFVFTFYSINLFASDLLVKEGQSLRSIFNPEVTKIIEAKKYTFINFWATWCLPCVHELPDFMKLSENQNQNGIGVLLLNADEKAVIVGKFLKNKEINLTNVIDKDRKQIDALGINTLPYTLIVDKELKLVRILRGSLNLEKLSAEASKLK